MSDHLPPLPSKCLTWAKLEWSDAEMRAYGQACYEAGVASMKDGPQMIRGTRGDGSPWMGSMRDVLNDYRRAAEVEAKLGDEARAIRKGVG